MVRSRWRWNRCRFFNWKTRFDHCFQAVDKQFGWLSHHIVLEGYHQRNFECWSWKDRMRRTFVNGPANRQRPPNPQLCRKCNCCCDASSVANIFCMILWTANKTSWSFDTDKMLFIFWSSSECLKTESAFVSVVCWVDLSAYSIRTSQGRRVEKRLIPRLNIGTELAFLFHRWSISLVWPILLGLELAWTGLVVLLDPVERSIHLIQTIVIRVPIYEIWIRDISGQLFQRLLMF